MGQVYENTYYKHSNFKCKLIITEVVKLSKSHPESMILNIPLHNYQHGTRLNM
jgi:hypothetical protein